MYYFEYAKKHVYALSLKMGINKLSGPLMSLIANTFE